MPPSPETLEADIAQWMENADSRWRKLLTKILHEPGQVTQSVLTHLGKDAAVWHNSLTFLSRKEPEGVAEMMRLVAEVIRQDKAGELFGTRELTDIARMSMGTWLTGKHQDQVDLRKRAAMVLGEMLDDPDRRDRAVAVLEKLENAPIPAPVDLSQGDGALLKGRLERALEDGLEGLARQMEQVEDSDVGIAMVRAAQAGLTPHYLDDADFVAASRMAEGEGLERPVDELLTRLAARMMDRAIFDAWKPKAPGGSPKP